VFLPSNGCGELRTNHPATNRYKGTKLALTTNAARLLGVDKERGAIRPGTAADLIAPPENPLENINALKQVSFVMKNGTVFKHAK
jgi:imidazolonepropionase-like amidohydrolase